MSQQEGNTASTEAILKAMDDLGPADANTIAEHSGVPYSTVARKLREWGGKGEICKIERGSKGAHWSLLPADQPLPGHLQPAETSNDPDPDPEGGQDIADQDHAASDDNQPATTDDAGDSGDQTNPADAAEADEPGDSTQDAEGEPGDGGDKPGGGAGDDPKDHSAALASPAVADMDGGADIDTAEAAAAAAKNTPDAAEGEQETQGAAEDASAAIAPVTNSPSSGRRPKNYFHTEGMALLRAHPDREFTIGEICKLVAAKEIAAGAPAGTKVSTGAMANAMHKAAGAGEALLACEKPAVKFRAA